MKGSRGHMWHVPVLIPKGPASMTLRLESIVCPCCMPQHPLEECVSRHNALSGFHTSVRPQCSCGSLYSLMCSLNSSKTLMLCAIDWLQDGCTRVTECASSQAHLQLVHKGGCRPHHEIVGALVREHQVSMSTIDSTVALACASGHQTATPEMN